MMREGTNCSLENYAHGKIILSSEENRNVTFQEFRGCVGKTAYQKEIITEVVSRANYGAAQHVLMGLRCVVFKIKME